MVERVHRLSVVCDALGDDFILTVRVDPVEVTILVADEVERGVHPGVRVSFVAFVAAAPENIVQVIVAEVDLDPRVNRPLRPTRA